MIKRLITHIKRWNKWRKFCGNGWLHKISVLFGGHSPTFRLTLTDEEIDEMWRSMIIAMRQEQRRRDQEQRRRDQELLDKTIEMLKGDAEDAK